MDVIILAAGENVRLQGTGLMPGHKPLLMVENEVLIRRLCRQARAWSSGRIIIVCSPTNAPEIVYATQIYDPHYVVQPEARGPQEAIDRGIGLCRSHSVLVLMGDNVFSEIPFSSKQELPAITVTFEHNEALHPMRGGFLSYDHESADAWWLGPMTFSRTSWLPARSNWIDALKGVRFEIFKGDAKDLGVIK